MTVNKLVCDIIEYINIHINYKISIDDLVCKFNYNRYYIMKLFKKELNISIINYINYKRVYNSLVSLNDTNMTILKAALDNGFTSQEYYTETFKNVMGVNPTTYKMSLNNRMISKKDSDLIIKNLIKIETTIENINKYYHKRNPKEAKSLSIFK